MSIKKDVTIKYLFSKIIVISVTGVFIRRLADEPKNHGYVSLAADLTIPLGKFKGPSHSRVALGG